MQPQLAPGAWQAVGAGFVSGGIATGSLRGAVIGAFSAAAFQSLGTPLAGSPSDRVGYSLAAGATGGTISVMAGGKFGHGFLSAGAVAATGSGTFQNDNARVVAITIVGGTVSEITGGKFANGAGYAAFASIVSEGIAAANRATLEQPSPSFNIHIGPSGTLDIRSRDYRLEASLSVDSPPTMAGPIGDVPYVDPEFSFSFSTTTSNSIGSSIAYSTGTDFTPQEIQMGAAIVLDHGNKFPSWFYGQTLEITGNLMTAYGAVGTRGVPLPYATQIGQGGALIEQAGKYLRPVEAVR